MLRQSLRITGYLITMLEPKNVKEDLKRSLMSGTDVRLAYD